MREVEIEQHMEDLLDLYEKDFTVINCTDTNLKQTMLNTATFLTH